MLWDVATGRPLRTLGGYATTVAAAAFSPDGTELATTDFYGNLSIREAAPLKRIDRHPHTLRSLFRLGVKQNRERNYAAAEQALSHVFKLQKELGDPARSETRAELTAAFKAQGKLPVFVRQPESVEVALGEQVTLHVQVGDEGPWAFQWFRNGHRVEGQTQSNLVLKVGSNEDVGSYHVEVTPAGRDDVDSVASTWAHVTERTEPDRPPPRPAEP